MAARLPQSGSSVAYKIKAAYASKILAFYWAAGADAVHRLYPGDTASTIITRSTSGAGFNSTDGRITGTVNGDAPSSYFQDSKTGGFGTNAGPIGIGISYYGDIYNGVGGSRCFLAIGGNPPDIFDNSLKFVGQSYAVMMNGCAGGSGAISYSTGGFSDDVKGFMQAAFRYDAGDPINKLRYWVNGAEYIAGRSSPTNGNSNNLGDATYPFTFGGTYTGSGNTVLEYECCYLHTGLSDAELDAITADPSIIIEAASDTTAPVLTSPVGTATGTTTATVGATTDEGNGTMYAVVTTSATQPSVAQIKAGQDHTGATAAWSGNQAISSTGAKTFSATGLVAATAYYAHVVHTDAAANDSNRVSSAQFTTDAPTAITSAPLENNTGSALASTLVDIVVAIKLSDRSTVVWLAQTTDGAGQLVLPSGSLVAAADYLLVTSNTAGTDAGVRKYTAA